jgi:CBS domain-containing protein
MSYSVKTYMRRDLATADVEASASEASKIMLEKDIGYLIVLDKAQPIGIVTVRDLVMKVMAKGRDPLTVKISEIMSSPLVTIDPDATIEDAVETMVKHGVRSLAVVRDSILYGTFGARDLARHFKEYEEKVTRDIIRSMASISLPF